MTDNIITTSNYTQLQLNELPGYNLNIVESGVKHPNNFFTYRILLQIIQNLYIQYFYVMSEFV